MLPSSPNVEDFYLGPSGLLRSSHGGADVRPVLLIDASTIDPMTTKKVAAAAQKCKLAQNSNPLEHRFPHPLLSDTPVSGGIVGAEKATLTFEVGGVEAAALEAAEPVLASMGKSIVHCGPGGSGQVAELCNNLALAIDGSGCRGPSSWAETGGGHAGPQRDFNTSSARCWSSDTYNPVPSVLEIVPSSRGYAGDFATRLMAKDISLALAAGKEAGAVIPLGAKVLELYTRMIDGSAPSKDFSAIFEHIYGGAPAALLLKTAVNSTPSVDVNSNQSER